MGTPLRRGDPRRRRRDRRAGVRLDAVHLHRVRADVLPVRRRALPVRAAGRGGGVRDDRVVHPVAHAGADARDAADGPRAARRRRRRSRACCSASTAASTARFERVRARLHAGAVGAAVAAARRSHRLFLGFCLLSCAAVPVPRPRLLPERRRRPDPPAHARADRHAHRGDRAPRRRGRSGDPRADPGRPARDDPRQPRRAQQRHQPVVQQRRHDRHARRRDPAVAASEGHRPTDEFVDAAARRAAEALSRHRVLLPAGRHRHADPELRPARGDRRAVHRQRPRAATRRSRPS